MRRKHLDQPVPKLFGQRLQPLDDAPDVGAGPLGMLDRQAPYRLAFHKVAAERRLLPFHALGKEGIAECQLRHRAEEDPLTSR